MMDELIKELKQLLTLKNTTAEGDIVILASVDPKMLVYALVLAIEPDPQRKRSWWNVTMEVLTLPPRKVVWTLREPQFTGQEVFTFDGAEHFMKAVRFDDEPAAPQPPPGNNHTDEREMPRSKFRIIK
jgi:hypothetical protein